MCLYVRMLALESKGRAFIEKVNTRCFCWFPATILVDQTVHQYGVSIQSSTKVCENNSETVGYKDLRFGQIVYILVFFNILILGFCHWTVSNLFFAPCLLRTVERKNERDFFLWIKSALSFPLILWALPIARFTAAVCWFIVRYQKNKIGKKERKLPRILNFFNYLHLLLLFVKVRMITRNSP